MATKRQHSKKSRAVPRPATRPSDPVTSALLQCAETQHQLTRTEEAAGTWQKKRRQAVRAAFAAGATSRDIAAAIQVSRTKVYQLLGSARALRT